MEVFIIGWEKGLLTKTGLIMEKKAMRGNMFGRKANGVQEVYNKKPEKKSAMPKEQRTGIGSGIW